MTMNPSEDTPHESIRLLGLKLLQQLDQVQATSASLSLLLGDVAKSGVFPASLLVGEVVHIETYCNDPSDGAAYIATLSIPGGLGAAVWNCDDLSTRRETLDELIDEHRERNKLLVDLPIHMQARLYSQLQPLVRQLLSHLGISPQP
jgi:hypothetical protein